MKKLLLATLVFMGASQQTQGTFAAAIAAAKIAGSWSVANLPKAVLTSVAFGIGQYVANQPAIEQAAALRLECSNTQQAAVASAKFVGGNVEALRLSMAPAMALAEKQANQYSGWWGMAKYGFAEISTATQMVIMAYSVYSMMQKMGTFSHEEKPAYNVQQYQQNVQPKAVIAGKQAPLIC
jgi:hypothetical protein